MSVEATAGEKPNLQQPAATRMPAALVALERHTLIFSLLLVLATLIAYASISHNSFTDFDDSAYLLTNTQVQQGLTWGTVRWSLTTFREGNWHPLTWWSHALDWQLFHRNPAGPHYVNLLLHAANAVLLFLLLRSATAAFWPSWLVAALFAIHPVNVESVAWAAERKNVLSMFFFLLTMLAYDRYTRSRPHSSYRRSFYIGAAVLFALGLMAKPQIVTLPFVLLLWDYWPLERMASPVLASAGSEASFAASSFWSLVWEKWPFFLLAAADSVVTVVAQHAGNTVRSLAQVSVASRLENVIVSYVSYLGKAVWPTRLAPLYPHPGNSILLSQVAGAVVLLLTVTSLVLWQRDRRYLATAWFWFLGTLVPMIGIITVGDQGMADRYAYLPFIGIFIGIVWSSSDLVSRYRIPAPWVAASACAVLCTLGFLTHRQVGRWSDDETLWRYTLTVTENNFVAENNLGLALAKAGRPDEAIVHFRKAAALHQYPADQMLKLGLFALRMGHFEEAVEAGKAALAVAPDTVTRGAALRETGRALLALRRFDEADQNYRDALRLNPDDADALVDLGLLALRSGDSKRAVDDFSRASKLDPRDVNFMLLAQALLYAGQPEAADQALAQAQKLSPTFNESRQAVAGFLALADVRYLSAPNSATLH